MAGKSGHIILAFLVLFSSTGLLVNQHFCRDELKDTAFFLPAQACHSAAAASCPMHAARGAQPKGCCDDQAHLLKHKQDQVQQEVQLPKGNSSWAAAALPLFSSALPEFDPLTTQYLNYKPPLIACDLPLSHQAFLL